MTKHTGAWQGIMVHHTATDKNQTVNFIRKLHLKRGFGDVGYHYLLQRDWNGKYHLKKGRDTVYQGAHCDVGNYNNTYIGLAIIGNFEEQKISESELQDLKDAIEHLKKKFNVSKVKLHRDVKATACPGKYIKL